MIYSRVVKEGIDRIYSEDFKSQEHYLKLFASDVRKMPADPLFKAKAFFVPNEDYISKYFGPEVLDSKYDFYDYDGNCTWQNYIMFPISNVAGNIVGFAGFDPLVKAMLQSETEERVLDNYYKYSRSDVFNRGKYIYMLPGVYERAVDEGYIILADGVFDMLSLDHHGFNAGSLLGSSVSNEIVFQLSFIKSVFVAEDNDSAGRQLYTELKKRLPVVKYVRQNKFKDADDILKSKYSQLYVDRLRDSITNNLDLTLRIKP